MVSEPSGATVTETQAAPARLRWLRSFSSGASSTGAALIRRGFLSSDLIARDACALSLGSENSVPVAAQRSRM